MKFNFIFICAVIFFVSIFIYCVKNFEYLKEYIRKKLEKKIFKILYVVVFILIFILIGIQTCKNVKLIMENIKLYRFSKVANEMYLFYDTKIKQENDFYKDMINKEYNTNSSMMPYILEGFKHIEGEWNTGFVIEDENQNQYVWVPCSNKESENIVKLEKRNFEMPAFISKDFCLDFEYEDFIKSALENGGFYISRFEIGNENGNPVSKLGAKLWKDVTKDEAEEIAENMYKANNLNCRLINGIAYDTALYWLEQTNNMEFSNIIFNESLEVYAGRNSFNNIYDLLDNAFELTSEMSYETVIIRGVLNNESYKNRNRYSIIKDENYFSEKDILTFRTIIYK